MKLKKNYSDSDRFSNVISREIIIFLKNLVVPELYAKMYIKMVKIRLRKKMLSSGESVTH